MTDHQVGAIIRENRKKLGLTQGQLAEKIGVTWEMISRYERGRSSALLKILELSVALNISPSIFLGGTGGFSENSSLYETANYVPVLTLVPQSRDELFQAIQVEQEGTKLFTDSAGGIKFAINLEQAKRIRISVSTILSKGLLVCTTSLEGMKLGDIVVAVKGGLLVVENYEPGLQVLAKVVQWVVKFA